MAGNLLSPGIVLPRMGQFDLKGFLPPKPKLGGGGGLFSTQETRLWIIKQVTRSCQDQDPDPCVEGRGTLLGFQAAFSSSPLWFCNTGLQKKGTWLPWKCWRAKEGRQRPPLLLVLGPVPSGLLGLSSPWPLHVGQENLWLWALEPTTVPFTSSGPGHWHTLRKMAQACGLVVPG